MPAEHHLRRIKSVPRRRIGDRSLMQKCIKKCIKGAERFERSPSEARCPRSVGTTVRLSCLSEGGGAEPTIRPCCSNLGTRCAPDGFGLHALETGDWQRWHSGSVDEALGAVRVPAPELIPYGPANPDCRRNRRGE